MIDAANIPPIESDELLARYVTQSRQFRSRDRTLKPSLFIPPPDLKLSVTRHRDATDDEIWHVGRAVAETRQQTLYGRGNILCSDCEKNSLRVEPNSVPGNPNHADVMGWPDRKEDQKVVALNLAAAAGQLVGLPEQRDVAVD